MFNNLFGRNKNSSPTAFSLTVFRIRDTERYIVELGTPSGIRKRADAVREHIKTVDCVDREQAREELKKLVKYYNIK